MQRVSATKKHKTHKMASLIFCAFVVLCGLGLSSQTPLGESPQQARGYAHQHDGGSQLPASKHGMRSLERGACFVESTAEQTQLSFCEFQVAPLQLHDPRQLRAFCHSQIVGIRDVPVDPHLARELVHYVARQTVFATSISQE